ncbi:hypothetical protein Vretimale_6059 [Volvox reticuliferus]|uniref:Thioredoxin domain-containing protein n=1 Tax=Volvox reticuliferus TaxID=1737510 RepID=A0A8J4G737_9CHLO|nr:hypothetical protein Vretifemale_20816 [Volvox reticuliferus]GIM01261.1 hypothetical protein Vretimale_6059 [Volvox reticuliferus]
MAEKPSDIICDGDVCRRVTPEEAAAKKDDTTSKTEPRVFALLGASPFIGKGEAKVPLSSITGPNKVIGLYFSAHWCPPCRHFTPQLASAYTNFKESHPRAADWEIIFISRDRDQESFDDYFSGMPWLALPRTEEKIASGLSKLFDVSGIPTLVIINGETGAVITTNGREAVDNDPECALFPWVPKAFREIMEGATLVDPPDENSDANADAAAAPALERLAGKVTLLYFSASWCPPCRRFTPELVKTMKALREAGKAVEAVFLSADREEKAMKEYHSHMTWPALPFSDKARNRELNQRFDVEGIPTLVVLDEDFNIITTEGVGAVRSDPTGSHFPWRPQPMEQLSERQVDRINKGPMLLLIATTDDAEAAGTFAKQVLEPVAVATREAEGGDEWTFVWALAQDDLASRILKFAGGLELADKDYGALLLDVPSQMAWDLGKLDRQISEAGLAAVVADYKAGKLENGRKLFADDDD